MVFLKNNKQDDKKFYITGSSSRDVRMTSTRDGGSCLLVFNDTMTAVTATAAAGVKRPVNNRQANRRTITPNFSK